MIFWAVFISNIPTNLIVLFPIAALLYSAGYLFFFKGVEILAIIFLKDKIAILQGLGIAATVVGIIVTGI